MTPALIVKVTPALTTVGPVRFTGLLAFVQMVSEPIMTTKPCWAELTGTAETTTNPLINAAAKNTLKTDLFTVLPPERREYVSIKAFLLSFLDQP